MNQQSLVSLPFGVGHSITQLQLAALDTKPVLTDLPYRGSRSLPTSLSKSPTDRAVYRLLIPDADPAKPPEVYIGKTTSMRRRIQDYLEMSRRLRAYYARHPIREDKHPYRYVHYALARAGEEGRASTLSFYCPTVSADWELERIELKELAAHVQWSASAATPCYDYRLLNCLPSLKRFSGSLNSPAWEAVRASIPRRERNAA
jgi:hypothetical protein